MSPYDKATGFDGQALIAALAKDGFEVIRQIEKIEVIAVGTSIRNLAYPEKTYGSGQWRKLKGRAHVRLPNENIRWVELHWYEAHGDWPQRHQNQTLCGMRQ